MFHEPQSRERVERVVAEVGVVAAMPSSGDLGLALELEDVEGESAGALSVDGVDDGVQGHRDRRARDDYVFHVTQPRGGGDPKRVDVLGAEHGVGRGGVHGGSSWIRRHLVEPSVALAGASSRRRRGKQDVVDAPRDIGRTTNERGNARHALDARESDARRSPGPSFGTLTRTDAPEPFSDDELTERDLVAAESDDEWGNATLAADPNREPRGESSPPEKIDEGARWCTLSR